MKPIYEAWCCQIELTNYCWHDCLYCSRYNKHIRKDQRFHMDLDFLKKALLSLESWPAKIGIIGGEPILHPEFKKCCDIIQSIFPRDKMGLWTSGGAKYAGYKDIIDQTFGFVAYNEHNKQQQETCRHQPITLSIHDLVPDEDLRHELIEDCWVQRTWCPTINPKGAFFCEVAGALDIILDGPGGYDVKHGWWKKAPEDFNDQVRRTCLLCGMAIPYGRDLIKNKKEKFSFTTYELFHDHELRNMGPDKVKLITQPLSVLEIKENAKTWFPGNYRGDNQVDENSTEGKGSTIF